MLQWAETIWTEEGTVTQTLLNFIEHFREVFGRPTADSSIGEQLYHFRQSHISVFEYSLKYRTLPAASSWNEHSLFTTYLQGLDLAAYDDTIGLERFFQVSIRLDSHMQSCLEEHQGQSYATFLRQLASICTP